MFATLAVLNVLLLQKASCAADPKAQVLYEVKYEPLKDDEPIRYSETKPQSPIDQSLNASQLHQAEVLESSDPFDVNFDDNKGAGVEKCPLSNCRPPNICIPAIIPTCITCAGTTCSPTTTNCPGGGVCSVTVTDTAVTTATAVTTSILSTTDISTLTTTQTDYKTHTSTAIAVVTSTALASSTLTTTATHTTHTTETAVTTSTAITTSNHILTSTSTSTHVITTTETALTTSTAVATSTSLVTATETSTATETLVVTSTAVDTSTHVTTATQTSVITSTAVTTSTQTSTKTETATATQTVTATETSTAVATITATSTAITTSIATLTQTSTATETVTQTSTATETQTATSTAVTTDTVTATVTATETATATNTLTTTSTALQTLTLTETAIETSHTTVTYTTNITNFLTQTETATLTSTSTHVTTSTQVATSTAVTTETQTDTSTSTHVTTATQVTTNTITTTHTIPVTATATTTLTTTSTGYVTSTQTQTSTETMTKTETATLTTTQLHTSTSIITTCIAECPTPGPTITLTSLPPTITSSPVPPTRPPTPRPPEPCTQALDVGVIIDASDSVKLKDFQTVLKFVASLTSWFSVSEKGTHFGVIVYSSQAYLHFHFNEATYWTASKLQAKILSLPWIGSGTRTDKALRLADSQLFTAPAGDRPAQPNVLVVITDGRTNPQQSEPYPAVLEPLKKKSVIIIAVGVGPDVDKTELKTIALGDSSRVFQVNDFGDLQTQLGNILNASCKGKCKIKYHKVGCFKDDMITPRPMPELLLTDRDPSSKVYSGVTIDWVNYATYLPQIVCRCAEAARIRGFSHFGVQYYGECWSGPQAANTYYRSGVSTTCLDGEYKACTDQTVGDCTGKQKTNFVYSMLQEANQFAYSDNST